MADVSQQRIATLTQTASQTPQFQASPNPVAAGLGAVQMGLDFYAKNKAEEQLKTIEQQQSMRNKDMAAGALELLEGRQRLSSQGAKSIDIEKFQKRVLSRYDPETALGVLSQANKVGKGSLSSTISEADAKAQERVDLEEEAAGLNGLLPNNLPANPTDEELQAFVLEGKAEQAYYQNLTLKSSAEASRMNTAEAKRKVKLRAFGTMASRFVGAQASSLVQEAVSMTDMTAPAQKQELVTRLGQELLKVPQLVDNFAQAQDITLTTVERDAQAERITSQLQGAIDFLTSDNANKISKNSMTAVSNKVLFAGLASEDSAVRNSAASVMYSLSNGITPSPEAIAQLDLEAMKALSQGNIWEKMADEANVEYGEEAFRSGISLLPGIYKKGETEDPAQSQRAYNTAVNNLTGSPEKLSDPRQKQVVAKIVEGIGEAGDALNILPENRRTLGNMLRDVMEPRLVSTFQSFMEEGTKLAPPTASNRNSMTPPPFTARGGERYSFNPDTLEVRPADSGAQMGTRARNLNKLVRDTLKAYEALGVDTEPFKDSVRNAFGMNMEEPTDG